mgnify:CR=1 FL=1
MPDSSLLFYPEANFSACIWLVSDVKSMYYYL